MDPDPNFSRNPERNPERNYALSGKIMLTAIVVLFAVIVFMIVLHVYARWYLLRARRRHLSRRSRRRTQLVFYVEPNALASSANRGLDAHIIKSLPVVLYSNVTDPGSLECAVCLSEFEEKEEVRLLPKCNHGFHVECIDMWFHSHSTCPLCRSPVEAPPSPLPEMKADHVAISIDEGAVPEMGSSSGVCPNCIDHPVPSSSSVGDRRKAFEMERVTIDVPRRVGGDDESGASHGFRSPASRLLSLKRILSMNRKAAVPASPSARCGTSFTAAVNEVEDDVECGRGESTQQRTRTDTPRPR